MALAVSRKEVYRYLGYRGVTPSDEISAKIEVCLSKLQAQSAPRSFYLYYPITGFTEDSVSFADITVHSRGLARNLRGCSEICLMAVTIGIGADRLVARAQLTSMLDAAIYQAAGAAMVEAWCDEINRRIIEEAAKKGLHSRLRFSPGYGDFSLEHQKDFARLLNMPKNAGISLSDTLLMTPSKSVTAVIGLSTEAKPCVLAGCEECSKADSCAYRR